MIQQADTIYLMLQLLVKEEVLQEQAGIWKKITQMIHSKIIKELVQKKILLLYIISLVEILQVYLVHG